MVTVAGRLTTAFAASTPGPVVGTGVGGAASLSTILSRHAPPSVMTEPLTEVTPSNSRDPPVTCAPTNSLGGRFLTNTLAENQTLPAASWRRRTGGRPRLSGKRASRRAAPAVPVV